MGSIDGFLKTGRELPKSRTVESRVRDYKELVSARKDKLAVSQASRCMDCGIPFCHNGCPLGNLIPDFNDRVYLEDWEGALDLLLMTNNFPEFTGRVCPAPCEASCVLGINKPAVAIEFIEKSIVEKGFDMGLIQPRPPSSRNGKSVGIVGSGPAGLAAAEQLNRGGFEVTVMERDEKPGGLLRFGIPDFKLEKWVVERRIDLMEKEGVRFELGCHVGKDLKASDLVASYDAVVLTGGCMVPRDLPVEGRNLKGIHFAMEFLTQQNRRVSGLPFTGSDIPAGGKDVIVLGGGDTGSDCIGTSRRQKARSIKQFELLDIPPKSRKSDNPWPEWPLIYRTSSSQEEGCERQFSILTESFQGNGQGRVKGLLAAEVERVDGKFTRVEGSEQHYPCDLVLLAMGFVHPRKEGLLEDLGVELDGRGQVKTDKFYRTSVSGVYAAGDMRRGQSLVVHAIAEGRELAWALERDLGSEQILRSRQESRYSVVEP